MELSKQERKNLKAQQRLLKASRETSLIQENVNQTSTTPQETLTVICVKFGTGYGREYVERLRNMVDSALENEKTFLNVNPSLEPFTYFVLGDKNEEYLKYRNFPSYTWNQLKERDDFIRELAEDNGYNYEVVWINKTTYFKNEKQKVVNEILDIIESYSNENSLQKAS